NGMLSNMYNYFVFKATEEDARLLERNLSIDIPDEVIRSWESLGETKEELQLKSITQLGVRECLVRAYLKGQFYPCFKSKTVDVT
ncbi:MAG: hypothetical protein M1504_01645, partial [Candidatus Marsarchaeota archaeon]|nr:hypothetical protein [Candidatus Marsarchaeota archaeon]